MYVVGNMEGVNKRGTGGNLCPTNAIRLEALGGHVM
jgi:hypothetical protein